MSRRVIIEPVTRVEGHAKITIDLDDQGAVERARFHVLELRGFEKFCVGRPVFEMPSLTARICGICPVSHILASSKAGDAILAVDVPPAAEAYRRLMNLGQIVQSHALSFFHLSAPDLLLGFDCPPERRNLIGLAQHDRALALGGIRLRQFGQRIIEGLGGKKVHPAWSVAGGVRAGLTPEAHATALASLPEVMATALDALERYRRLFPEPPPGFDLGGAFLGLVDAQGNWEHHGGHLRLVHTDGRSVELDPATYHDWLGEKDEDWTFLRFPYYMPWGYPEGSYRVGPLARVNICQRMGTPRADALLEEFRARAGRMPTSSFHYHEARLIEIVACLEKIEALLHADLSGPLRARASVNRLRGVGWSEAPRGTLFHDYQVDEHGLLRAVNLVIATGQNNAAMNQTVTELARCSIVGPEIPETALNRIEAGIRAYDPCLSCSTHALGQMPMVIELRDARGRLLDRRER